MTHTTKIPNIAEPFYVDGRIDLGRLISEADYRRCALGRILEGYYTQEGLEQIVAMPNQIRIDEVQMVIEENEAMLKRAKLSEIIKAAQAAIKIQESLYEELDLCDLTIDEAGHGATIIPFTPVRQTLVAA